jgi:ferredoxin
MRCAPGYEHKLGGSDVACYRTRCVGCGRCVETCLSRLGMIRVVRELLQEEGPRHGRDSRGP